MQLVGTAPILCSGYRLFLQSLDCAWFWGKDSGPLQGALNWVSLLRAQICWWAEASQAGQTMKMSSRTLSSTWVWFGVSSRPPRVVLPQFHQYNTGVERPTFRFLKWRIRNLTSLPLSWMDRIWSLKKSKSLVGSFQQTNFIKSYHLHELKLTSSEASLCLQVRATPGLIPEPLGCPAF